jgi:hypothetical protein
MNSMPNGHFSGKTKGMIDNATEKAKGTSGKFYEIMTKHGFFDIADESNNLTAWQRAGVPEYNQHRISDLCDAIAEMLQDYLSNEEYGVLCPGVEGIVNKLDQRGAMSAAELDGIGAALGGLTGGAAEATRQSLSNLVASIQGGCKFDPEVVPPICIGFSGLPISFANAFKKGSYPPDWTFLYDHETFKSNKFYEADDGSVAIGAGIKLNTGGIARLLVLKMIFSVPDVDEEGRTQGDAVNGITAEQFNTLYEVSDKRYSELTDEQKEFELTEGQLQLAYFKMIQLLLWGAIKNDNNWAYLHWGCITHNSCPEAVKTAVCSYLKTNGLAVDPKICPESGFISYCANVGMAYLIGSTKTMTLHMLPDMTYLDDNKKVVTATTSEYGTNVVVANGVPQNKKLAYLHFQLIADLLSHMTYDSNPNAYELRKRRIDEANKIYRECGVDTIEFGKIPAKPVHTMPHLLKRNFGWLVKGTIKVYENKNISIPVEPKNFKIVNWAEKGSNEVSDITMDTIRYILAKAQVPGVVITSVYRSPEAQTRSMLNNRQSHNGQIAVNYGARGREVDQQYTDVSKRVNNGVLKRLEKSSDIEEARKKMLKKCEDFLAAGTPVSNHGQDQNVVQAVDMGPASTRKEFHYSEEQLKRINNACYEARLEGYLKAYFGPAEYGGPKVKDPAFHIEVWQDKNKPHPPMNTGPAPQPTVPCFMNNDNMKNKNAWDMVFTHDQTLKATK